MAKKTKKSFGKKKTKLTAAQKAQKFAEQYGVELDESNIASVKATLKQSAHGKYKDDITGLDIGRAYLTQRTRGEFFRDWEAAQALAGVALTEEEFIRNIDEYDANIEAEIERIRRENPNATGSELAYLIATQVFGSPD